MASAYSEEIPRDVICPSCGSVRRVSGRHARRSPTCSLCRYPARVKPITNSDRRFWLKTFSDEEIIEIAFWMFNREGDIEAVRTWRAALYPDKEVVLVA